MLQTFENQNKVSIEVCLHRWTTHGQPDISVSGKAWAREADRRAAKPLGYVNVQWRAERFRSLEGLITYLLYQLDFAIASNELENVATKKADSPAAPG
jgi:hypothetical protein